MTAWTTGPDEGRIPIGGRTRATHPITICRGHLEVLDADAGEQEVRAVKKVVVDELDLMGRPVDDLATLARMDDRVMLTVKSLPSTVS